MTAAETTEATAKKAKMGGRRKEYDFFMREGAGFLGDLKVWESFISGARSDSPRNEVLMTKRARLLSHYKVGVVFDASRPCF